MDNKFYKIGTGIGIVIIIAIVACIVVAKNRDKKIAEESQSLIMSSTNIIENEELESTETKESEFNIISEETNKKPETNTTANTKRSESKEKTVNKSEKKIVENKVTEKENEIIKDPTFKYPVKGEIIQDYADEQLVYSQTLGEWVTHRGIDIKANKTTVVGASADGKVKSIKNDPRYGLTVVVEHSNGFCSVYANLLTAEFVSVGENVKQGQTLGTVGNTAAFEILDEPHLHFEITKDGESVDPNMYLKN